MSVRDDLNRLSAAEDFFRYLDVPFEKRILDVARLHILRRMADTLAKEGKSGQPTGEDEARAHYRAHLKAAYDDFVARAPLDERVFKVLKEAVAEKAGPFVPLSALGPR